MRGLLHKLLAVTLGVAGIVAVARLGPRRTASVVAAVMTVSFVAATVLVLLDDGGVLPGNPSGVLERVALFAGFGWIGLVGGRAAATPTACHPDAVSRRTAARSGDRGRL